MLGRLFIVGIDFLISIPIKPWRLKGIKGQRYGVFKERVDAKTIIIIVTPRKNPGTLNK